MTSQPTIRVIIGGGNPINRAGLSALLTHFPNIEVLTNEDSELPAVIVWDAGLDLAQLPNHPPQSFLLVLTDLTEVAAFPAGITGLFSKDESPEALATAIRQVSHGQQYLSPSFLLSILRNTARPITPNHLEQKMLIEREQEILALLAQGLSNKAIAARLYLSVRTIEGHLDKIYSHFGVHSRTEAILMAMQHQRDR